MGVRVTATLAPGVLEALLGPGGPRDRFPVTDRAEEYDALLALLLANATDPSDPDTREVASAVAAGCLGQAHLWHDLGLPERPALRALISAYFAPLAAENDRDIRWKLFFYRKLCGWGGFST